MLGGFKFLHTTVITFIIGHKNFTMLVAALIRRCRLVHFHSLKYNISAFNNANTRKF